MLVKIERVKNYIVARLPREAKTPDAQLRSNIFELIEAKDIKAILIDMAEIAEITDALAALVVAIQNAAGRKNLRVIYFNLAGMAKDYFVSSGLAAVLEIYGTELQALRMVL